jgi:hypothetical protein
MTDSIDHSLRKRRPRCDPNAPKTYKNAYIHYSTKKRNELITLHPEWTPQLVSREIGRMWKHLSPSKKKPWIELAQFDKSRFHTELNQYLSSHENGNQSTKGRAYIIMASNGNCNTASPSSSTPPNSLRIRIPHARNKDPNAPKPPDSAYICFWRQMRRQVLHENPLLDSSHVSKEVARRWKMLDKEELQHWNEISNEDKLRYEQEIQAYTASGYQSSTSSKKMLANMTPIRDPYAPKSPTSAFQYFMRYHQSDGKFLNLTLNRVRAEMGKVWRSLNEEEKQPFRDLAAKDRVRFQTEMNAYKAPPYLSTNYLIRRNQETKEAWKLALKKDPKAPKLPRNAYMFFSPSKRKEIELAEPELKYNDVMKKVGLAWKEMSAQKKEPYFQLAEEDETRFEVEMAEYKAAAAEATPIPGSTLIERGSNKALHVIEGVGGKETDDNNNEENDQENYRHHFQQLAISTKSMSDKRTLNPMNSKRSTASGVGKTIKDPEIPRKPQTAYNLMYMSRRNEVLASYHMSHNECASIIGRMWRQMSEEERQPYHLMAAEDKLRYELELKEYERLKQNPTQTNFAVHQNHRHIEDLQRSLKRKRSNLKKNNADKRIADVIGNNNSSKSDDSATAYLSSGILASNSPERDYGFGFLYFLQVKRDELMDGYEGEHGSSGMLNRRFMIEDDTDIQKDIKKLWNSMSTTERNLWTDIALEKAEEKEEERDQQQHHSVDEDPHRIEADLDALCEFVHEDAWVHHDRSKQQHIAFGRGHDLSHPHQYNPRQLSPSAAAAEAALTLFTASRKDNFTDPLINCERAWSQHDLSRLGQPSQKRGYHSASKNKIWQRVSEAEDDNEDDGYEDFPLSKKGRLLIAAGGDRNHHLSMVEVDDANLFSAAMAAAAAAVATTSSSSHHNMGIHMGINLDEKVNPDGESCDK